MVHAGTNVIEAKGVAKAYDKLLYDNLNFTLPAGIVGYGPNGAGKSTIFRMIMGEKKARCRRICDW
jgi:ABC-type multidrug transport system ATPase subunit